MEMNVLRADDQLTHVSLSGRLDLPGVQAIELKFLAQTASRRKPAIADLSGVSFISSMGMRMLLSAGKSLKPSGAKLVVLNPTPETLEALNAAGMQHVTPIVSTLPEALALCGIQ